MQYIFIGVVIYKLGARAKDVYGRIPLHYAVDKPNYTNIEVIQRLLKEYPEGIFLWNYIVTDSLMN